MKYKVVEKFAVKTDRDGNPIDQEFEEGQTILYKTPTVYDEEGNAIAETGNKVLQALENDWMKPVYDE